MTFELALFALLVFLQWADYYTTTQIIYKGGGELNPILKWLMLNFGVEEGLIFKGFCIIIFGAVMHSVVVLATMDVIFAAAVIWNFRQMSK